MRWREKYSLSTQFLAAAAVVLCASMAVLGTWVNHRITRSVLATSGADGAVFMRGLLQQYVQRITPLGELHPEDVASLDRLFVGTIFGNYIVSVKIWLSDGSPNARIIYSSMAKETIGQVHVSTDVQKSWKGQLVSEFEDMISKESLYEQGLNIPLIEIYHPLYRTGSRDIIAVGEIYEDATILAQQIRESVLRTWLVVCVTTLLMIAVLYLIVRRGSQIIEAQKAALNDRVRQAQVMASQNYALRLEADRSRLDANEANEELLGRIGMDIHDGPIQLLTLTRLKLDDVTGDIDQDGGTATSSFQLTEISEQLSTIIDELRDISVGLVLPELKELSVRDTIELAIERHQQLTGTVVEFEGRNAPSWVAEPVKTCIYRLVQETLSNAFKHAGGRGQRVSVDTRGRMIELEIRDEGIQMQSLGPRQAAKVRLGQKGIRNRVTALNGTISIDTGPQGGTRVSVSIPYQTQDEVQYGSVRDGAAER